MEIGKSGIEARTDLLIAKANLLRAMEAMSDRAVAAATIEAIDRELERWEATRTDEGKWS